GVQWSRSPRLTVSPKDLQGEARSVVVLIEADEKGKITNVRVTRSSGIPSLDDKVVRAVRSAKFKPYMENGVAYPIKAEQPFDLTP
ncbi:energy transducer TonB, partial [Acinetobacter baumannii]|nr:energy transducer TonB [Acinetobacter baumannii]ELW9244682.1 energy transducer TonB [Acinetobacter baumannii]MDC4261943.1 energy transducer TonB [Acinetobacter baumannii]